MEEVGVDEQPIADDRAGRGGGGGDPRHSMGVMRDKKSWWAGLCEFCKTGNAVVVPNRIRAYAA